MNAGFKVMCGAVAALFLVSGCGRNDASVPAIRVQEIRSTDDLSSTISVNSLIVMEESDNGLLVHPDKAFILPDGSFIFKDKGSRILKFSSDGTFDCRIGLRGRGPQEYSLCRDIALSRDGAELSVMDLGRILTYSAGDGRFIRKIEIPQHNYDEFCCGPDGGYYLSATAPEREDYTSLQPHDVLTLISSDGSPVLQAVPRKDYIMNAALFSRTSKGTVFLRPLEGENLLYEVTDEGIMPVMSVDFGSLQSPSGYLVNNGKPDMAQYIMSKYYKMALYFHDTDNALYFGCMGPEAAGLHYLTDASGKNGCAWRDMPDDPSPTMVVASDSQSFYALVFDVKSKIDLADKELNPLDRVIVQEVRRRNLPVNDNPLMAVFSYSQQ